MTYTLITANVLVFLAFNVPLGRQGVRVDDPRLPEYVAMLRDAMPPGADLRGALVGLTAFDLFVFEHGFRPARPEAIDLLTSMFLHGGLMHLFGNMLFLWIYGDNVEYRLGWWRYILAYLGTGVAATVAFAVMSLGSKVPMIGASGAISGVLGLYFIWFPRNVVRVFVFLFPLLMNVIEIPARIVLAIYLIVDNLLPMLFTGSGGGGVAHGAHIGGFVAGLAVAWGTERLAAARTPPGFGSSGLRKAGALGNDSPSAALARGDVRAAGRAYFGGAGALSPEELLRLADGLAESGESQAAMTAYLRHIRDHPNGPGAGDAHVGVGLLLLAAGQIAGAYQYLRRGLELNPSPPAAQRALRGLTEIASRQKYPMTGLSRR